MDAQEILATPTITVRELDSRTAAGLTVRLLLDYVGETWIEIYEGDPVDLYYGIGRNPEHRFTVPADKAAEAFRHPYAFAP